MFELRTARLVLRDMLAEDTALVEALSAEPSVTRYQSWLRLDDAQHAQRWVADVMHHNVSEPRGAYNLAIVERATGRGIGWIGWGTPSDGNETAYSFGYALLPACWNRGYMSETLAAMLRWSFENTERSRIYGECAASNVASRRAMEKAGLRLIAHWEEPDDLTGEMQQQLRLAITGQEWQVAQQAEKRGTIA